MRCRILPFVACAVLASCGLAEDERDDENRRIYLRLTDPAFEAYCLEKFDLDFDGRLSRYEAQRVVRMDCAGRGIGTLSEIGEFVNLQHLDCSRNGLRELDLRRCVRLRTLSCAENELVLLELDGLRSLTAVDCRDNALPRLDLLSGASLSSLDCRRNRLTTLDVRACAVTLKADVRENPALGTVYCREGQSVAADGRTEVIVGS